jgi:hypothetical protein
MIPHRLQTHTVRKSLAAFGEESMEENTSKVYLEPAEALLSQASGAGSPLFVINLCASMAPATLTGKSLPGLDSYRLYQVSRVEDGRTRYRLRLGFFTTQDAANRVLETVRQQYATAFTTSLSDEDRRYTRGYVPDTSATSRMRVVSVVPPSAPPVAATKQPVKQAPPQVAARAATPTPAKPAPIAQAKAAPTAPVAKSAIPAAPVAKAAASVTTSRVAAPAASAPQAKSPKTSDSGVYETTWEPQRAAAAPAKSGTTGSYRAMDPKALATGSFKALDKTAASGTFRTLEQKALATGAFRTADHKAASGSFRALDPKVAATGTHKALEQKALATGSHKAFEQKAAATGMHRALEQKAVATGMHKALEQKAAATGSHRALEQKAVATGMHKALEQKASATGSHRALEQKAPATGSHRALEQKSASTGSYKALDQSAINEIEISWNKPAAKVPQASAPARAASAPVATKPAAAPAATKPATAPVVSKAPPVLKPEPAVQAKPAAKAAAPTVKAPPAPAAKTPAKAPEAKNPPVTVKPSAPMKLELEAAPVAAPKQAASATPSNQPFHVGKGVNIPQVALSLETGKHSKFTPAAAPVAAKAPAAPANKAAAPSKPAAQPPVSSAKSPGALQLPPRVAGLPDLDSTQTIRALTNEEMNDANQEKWWAIQLAVSDQPLNLDAMPHLDIFEAYRLYSVASAGSGKILHSLRLGFFREAVSAEAVSGYLKTFFPTPSVLRISTAEQARFKDAPAPKTPPKVESKVIDLNDARDRVKPVVPMVTMEVADRSPTGTFKPGAGTFKNGNSGTYKALNKPAQAPAAKAAAAKPAVAKRPAAGKQAHMQTGKYRAQAKGSLQEQLLEAAREVELTESGIRRLPKSDSLLARLVDRLKK